MLQTITFATTQMNLINCVEYISSIEGHHTLVVDSASSARKRQIQLLLNVPAYSSVFDKIIYRSNKDSRFFDLFNTLAYHIKLFVLSKTMRFDEVISGNYLCCGSRLFYKFLPSSAKYIACDDGTGTIVVAKERAIEDRAPRPMMYIPNRFLERIICKAPEKYIPEQITFFTNYEIAPNGKDIIIKHDYTYLKQHLSDFNVNPAIFNSNVIVLGEPLYFKDFTTKECYANKLKRYAETANGTVVYYAHPEETVTKWTILDIKEKFQYIDNFLPFEIIAALLPENCRVATFVSSVLMNIRMVNDKLKPECICFKREEILPKFSYDNVLKLYEHYKSIGVTFYEFD